MKKIITVLLSVLFVINFNLVFANQQTTSLQNIKNQKKLSLWQKISHSKLIKKIKEFPNKIFKKTYDRLTIALIFLVIGILFLALGFLGDIVYVVGVIFFLIGAIFLLLYLL